MSAPVSRPAAIGGLRHVALFVERFEETVVFYTQLLGMNIEWQPDADNVYLSSGNDNLALHRYHGAERPAASQRLDHVGFIIDSMAEVDQWYAFLSQQGVRINSRPKTHRDGARSFYCLDPDGTVVQLIYHPPISAGH